MRTDTCTATSGLHLALLRSYDSDTARWLNRDPSAERGGVNLYGYVRDNPINLLDPLGFDPFGNPVSGPTGPVGPSSPYAPGGLYYPDGANYKPYIPTLPPNYTAPNPSGTGIIIFDSGVSCFRLWGGGGGSQIIVLANGQVVTYGYIGGGIGYGGKGGNFGLGEVYGVYQPTDYAGSFLNVSGGYAVGGGSISSQPLRGQNGAASYTAGAGTTGISATYQWYWIIDATDPISK